MTKINKRAVAQLLIILLLIVLVVFLAGDPIEKVRPLESKPRFKDAPFSTREGMKEARIGKSGSPPEAPKAVIEPLSHSGWVNQGAYEVFGEVKNVGAATGRDVSAAVTLKDAEWNTLGHADALIDRPRLAPGEKSAFKVRFRTKQPDDVKGYVLIVTISR
jgi:hypothetical protein